MADLFADAEAIAAAALRHLRTMPVGARLSTQDREDLAHEAYTKMLERNAKGQTIEHPIAYAQQTVSRLALNHVSRGARRFEGSVDPTDESFANSSPAPGPEATMFAHIDVARVAAAVETMPPEVQAIYRARVTDPNTTTKALASELGIGYSTARKRLAAASDHLRSALTPDGASPAVLAAYKLLSAYYSGIATARERRAAELLLKTDPAMRVHYRGLVRAHRAAGAMIAPFGIERGAGVGERLTARLEQIKDGVEGLFVRGSAGADAGTVGAATAGSSATRGIGAALAAKLAAVGAGGQAAVACLAGGGAVVVCVATGVLPSPLKSADQADAGISKSARTESVPAVEHPTADRIVSDLPTQVDASSTGSAERTHSSKPKERERQADGSDRAPIVEQSAPPVQQEFGVPAAATPVTGAPPDTDDSNGAAASTVRGEFGP